MVDEILENTKTEQYGIRSLIREVVLSEAFRNEIVDTTDGSTHESQIEPTNISSRYRRKPGFAVARNVRR